MAEKLEIVITADTRMALNQMGAVEKGATRMGKRVSRAGKMMAGAFKIATAAAAAAATVIAVKSVRAASDYDRAMSEVWTITNLTEEQISALTEKMKEFSVRMGVDATQSARGLYQTISAGVTDTEEALRLMEIATKASIGGLTSQEVAVDALTTVLNAYGQGVERAERASDILFTTVRLGKIRFEELGAGIGRVVPLAAAADVRFEEVAAAVAALTKHGISADIAMTSLRGVFQTMLKPGKETQRLAEEYNIELGIQALKGKGLAGILETLAELYSKDREAVVKLFPNVRALVGVLSLLTDNSADYTSALRDMDAAQGATTAAFEKMNRSASRQFEIFKAELNVAMIDLGSVAIPALIGALEGLKPEIEGVSTSLRTYSGSGKDAAAQSRATSQTFKDLTEDIIAFVKILAWPLKPLYWLGQGLAKVTGLQEGMSRSARRSVTEWDKATSGLLDMSKMQGQLAERTKLYRQEFEKTGRLSTEFIRRMREREAKAGLQPVGAAAAPEGVAGEYAGYRITPAGAVIMTGSNYYDVKDPTEMVTAEDPWRDKVAGKK